MKRSKRIITFMSIFILTLAMMIVLPDEVSAATKTPGKVTLSSVASSDYNAIKISWKKSTNAKKYEVYRATSKTGKYSKVVTTKYRTYTNKSLTTGKTYYYKVRAVNGSKKGKFSSVKAATPSLKSVGAFKVEQGSYTSAALTWNKVNGANGYQLFRASTKEGSYVRIKTTSDLSYTNKSLKPGKTYYYKVRAYRTVKGTKVYSKYTSVKSISIEERILSETHEFALSEGQNESIYGRIFENDVIISGDNATISFENCHFKGNIINNGSVGTIVILTGDTKVDGKCIIQNDQQEATLETRLPKFISDTFINVECGENCYGSAIGIGDIKIVFNDKTYDMGDSEYAYYYETDELVPYNGHEASVFSIAQWWENGEKIFMILCEE